MGETLDCRRKPHEEPEIPNYLEHGGTKSGPKIKNGMVFCIEPMICQKDRTPVILEKVFRCEQKVLKIIGLF